MSAFCLPTCPSPAGGWSGWHTGCVSMAPHTPAPESSSTAIFSTCKHFLNTNTHIHDYIHTYIQTNKHTNIHTYIHTYCTYIHTYKQTYIHYTHTYCTHIHTNIHIYKHTYIQTVGDKIKFLIPFHSTAIKE